MTTDASPLDASPPFLVGGPKPGDSKRRGREAIAVRSSRRDVLHFGASTAAANADECVTNVLAFIKEAGRESVHHGAPLRGRVPSSRAFQTAG